MRKTWTLLSVAVLAGVIALAGCGSEFDHGSVKGRIVSAVDGTPIAGAAVFIGSESDVTDASGLYAIEGINTGRPSFTSTRATLPWWTSCRAIFAPWRWTREVISRRPGR